MQVLDIMAVVFFFASWLGYAAYAKRKSSEKASLMGVMPRYRKQWMETMVMTRDIRPFDASLLGNLMRVTTFFASTTVLLLFATVAGFGAIVQIDAALSSVSFISPTPPMLSIIKLFVLAVNFTYAFFKFTWALRQYGFVSVLMGAASPAEQKTDAEQIIFKSSALENLASNNFTNGLRAYYFSLAVLAWFVHPLALVVATVAIVLVLNRREFHSDTLRILQS